ncbi:MAG: hypothetical protein EOP07_19500 [Proteobacteria bacterium]|nr:MAG: hypothetical protein EOP07_19500 [Pseudomonadota bacterium]
MNIRPIASIAGLSLLFACQPTENSVVKDAWNAENNPTIMMSVKNEFETNFDNLPLSGRPNKMPWSDHYWPTYHGGITYRWGQTKTKQLDKLIASSSDRQFAGQLDNNANLQKMRSEVLGYMPYSKAQLDKMSRSERTKLIATLSPAEKLDIYRGAFDYPTVEAERNRTEIFSTLRTIPSETGETFVPNADFVQDEKIPTWFGLCHAWAPATILFDEPGPLTVQSKDGFEVQMAASDIKALLTYVIDESPSQQRTQSFLAERCNNDLGDDSKKELEALVDATKLSDLDSINEQITAISNMRKFDTVTTLIVASHFYTFAPSLEAAQTAFQKLYERTQNRLKVGSSDRKKLAIAYEASLKNFADAGQADKIDRKSLKAAVTESVNISACSDTNAGSFHLVITNLLGIQKKSFGIDVTRDSEVWNQAAASFSSQVLASYQGKDISKGAAVGTVKEHLIETRFLYTTEEMPAWDRFGDNVSLQKHHVAAGDVYTANGRQYRALRYRIELNAQNQIIGGSWESNTRPDFIWGTGNFIWSKEFSDIEDLYYQSL